MGRGTEFIEIRKPGTVAAFTNCFKMSCYSRTAGCPAALLLFFCVLFWEGGDCCRESIKIRKVKLVKHYCRKEKKLPKPIYQIT